MDPEKKCHDCQALIELDGNEIKNGVLLAYKDEDGKEYEVCLLYTSDAADE